MPPSITDQITWVYTEDLDGTCRFYADVLGLSLAVEQGASRIYRTGPHTYLGVCIVRPGRWVEPKGLVITFVTKEIDGWHAHLVAKGIEAEAPAVSQTWGIYHFFARDPNGYVIEFQDFLNPAGRRPRPIPQPKANLRPQSNRVARRCFIWSAT